MKNTYLKPSAEIIRMEAGAFLDDWRISIPKDVEYGRSVGAKSRNPQGSDNVSTDLNALQDDTLAIPPSPWKD